MFYTDKSEPELLRALIIFSLLYDLVTKESDEFESKKTDEILLSHPPAVWNCKLYELKTFVQNIIFLHLLVDLDRYLSLLPRPPTREEMEKLRKEKKMLFLNPFLKVSSDKFSRRAECNWKLKQEFNKTK